MTLNGVLAVILRYFNKFGSLRGMLRKTTNSSGDEIATVNFFTTASYNTSKYNPLLNIKHDPGRGGASGCGLVVLVRRFSHARICCNKVRF